MSDEDDITTSGEDKHPVSGYVSVVLTIIALIMLMVIRPIGISAKDETGLSVVFVGYLFVSMAIAIVGGFFGFLGLSEDNTKRTFPIIGLALTAIFVALLAYIIVSSLM